MINLDNFMEKPFYGILAVTYIIDEYRPTNFTFNSQRRRNLELFGKNEKYF